jgi:hypothetical protein
MVRQVDEIPLGEKLLHAAAGVGLGGVVHHFAGLFRTEIEKNINEKIPAPEGYQIGTFITFLSMIMPEEKVKYFAAGLGVGATMDDVFFHLFENYRQPRIKLGDMPELDPILKYSSLLHIDENLSLKEKEAIILPYFPRVITEQRENPAQVTAIQRLLKEIRCENKEKLGLIDVYWMREWILYYGIYDGDEGLWPGHDRIRTLSKLMRVRDNSNWTKGGHPAFKFDCDDGATMVNQVMDYYGYRPKFILISQKKEVDEGLHPLHHIIPCVKAMGRLWVIETIKPLPVVPIDYIHELFSGLQRVVVVTHEGSYYEYDGWKANRAKKITQMTRGVKVSPRKRYY